MGSTSLQLVVLIFAQRWPANAPWHLQLACHEWQQEADRFLGKRGWVSGEVRPSGQGRPEGWGLGCQSYRLKWETCGTFSGPAHGHPWTNPHVLPTL